MATQSIAIPTSGGNLTSDATPTCDRKLGLCGVPTSCRHRPISWSLPPFPVGGTDGLIHISPCYGHMNFDRFRQPCLFSLEKPDLGEDCRPRTTKQPRIPPHPAGRNRPTEWPTREYHGRLLFNLRQTRGPFSISLALYHCLTCPRILADPPLHVRD